MSKKTLLVTGGTRGIGRAVSILACQRGYNVCANFLSDSESADELIRETKDLGGECVAVRADVSTLEGVKNLFFTCLDRFGTIDVLVNNAGIIEGSSSFIDITLDRLKRIMDVNVGSYFLCCKEAISVMTRQNSGVIINVSSAASRLGSPGEYVDYAMSKGAIDSMTIGLSKELSGLGIRVVGVRPGFIDTRIHGNEGVRARLDHKGIKLPAGRAGKPEEVAQTILFLASCEASYTHGCMVDMAGGL